jgi:hypothetical protein
MELLGDICHVEFRFDPIGDIVSVGARKGRGLHKPYHRVKSHFGRTQWYS